MTDQPSIVARGERAFDDIRELWKRRKFLCVIVIIAICLPTFLFCFDRFGGRSKLSSELDETKQELDSTKRDRDAKATQLAPFLALANARYENAPADKRLELLIGRLEAATQTLLQITKPTSRELSAETVKRIQEKLDFAKRVPISINMPIGSDESGRLGEQLRSLFEAAGFKVDVVFGIFTRAPKGISVRAKPPLSPELEDALLMVFKDLGEDPQFYQAENLPESQVSIIVGARPQ